MAAHVLVGVWWLSGIAIFIVGLFHIAIPRSPQLIQDIFLYGKARGKRKTKTFIQPFEIPKKWFLHFYIIGIIFNGGMLYLFGRAYFLGKPLPGLLELLLKKISTGKATTDASLVLLIICMMVFQNLRRMFECVFVSVYSSGTMNLIHYSIGLYHYSAFPLAMISETPSPQNDQVQNWQDHLFQPHVLLGVILFLYSSWMHNRQNVEFSKLRKNNTGNVITYQHKIPHGGWFELISCPHYLFEIFIYLSFVIVLGINNQGALAAAGFVTLNQVVAALITHRWYRKQFKSYPKERKALIPYIL